MLCDIGAAQLCSVTEIAPKTPFLCVNRSSIRYVFHAGPRAIQYKVRTWLKPLWYLSYKCFICILKGTALNVLPWCSLYLCYLLLSVIRPGMTQVIMQEPIIFKISLKVWSNPPQAELVHLPHIMECLIMVHRKPGDQKHFFKLVTNKWERFKFSSTFLWIIVIIIINY